MLYHLLYPFRTQMSVLNVTRYITFRTAAATLSALAISLAFGPWLVRKLREFQIGQVIRAEGPQTHRPKAGTPTMGGLLILTAALVPTLLWADLTNAYVWIVVLTTAAYGGIGFADDYLKIVRRSHHGLLPRYKMGFQILVGIVVGLVLMWLQREGLYNTRLVFPFFKRLIPDLGWWYLPFAVFVLVAESNAVNLTDGLDGLAISVFAIAAGAYTALAYVTGHRVFADYLLLVLVGGIFVLEALSVVLQVGYFKATGGKRLFRMAPLHHHFELIGWSEPKVITRFVIVGIIFALFSLATLKLR
jgi:phospho-N-acetylmuramoyl-pentapeptide-transferase